MDINEVWKVYKEEMYFFILKQLKDENATDEVLQNAFLKICLYADGLKEQGKMKAWIFQIVRNEVVNHVHQDSKYNRITQTVPSTADVYQDVCCLDRLIEQLPPTYRETIKLLYFEGKKQHEVANLLNISLANVKARTRRGKSILKDSLQDCCHYEVNKDSKLVGEADCACCES
ncbi:MAG: sigma-70 family RNA polymerase sigma factor [Bacteroidota bacterium]